MDLKTGFGGPAIRNVHCTTAAETFDRLTWFKQFFINKFIDTLENYNTYGSDNFFPITDLINFSLCNLIQQIKSVASAHKTKK